MKTNDLTTDDKNEYIKLIKMLHQDWRLILTSILLASSITAGVAAMKDESYSAEVFIQPSRLLGQDVESPELLAQKLRSVAYYGDDFWLNCAAEGATQSRVALVEQLRPIADTKIGAVKLSYRSNSPLKVTQCMNTILHNVIKTQQGIAFRQHELAIEELESLKKRSLILEKLNHEGLMKLGVSSYSHKLINKELLSLDDANSRLSIISKTSLLAPPNTREARFLVGVPPEPLKVDPLVRRGAVLGAGAGLLAGLLAAAIRQKRITFRWASS